MELRMRLSSAGSEVVPAGHRRGEVRGEARHAHGRHLDGSFRVPWRAPGKQPASSAQSRHSLSMYFSK